MPSNLEGPKPPKPLTVQGKRFFIDRLDSGAYRVFDQSQTRQIGYVLALERVGDQKKVSSPLAYGFHVSDFGGEPLPDAYTRAGQSISEAVGFMLSAIAARGRRK